MTRALIVLSLLLSGCLLQNASNSKKLSDTVHEMNKATRWGSLGMAVRMVEPGYRDHFVKTHRHWGQVIQVADTDIVQIEIAPDGNSAVAMVAYQWYQADMMTLHQTVVQQRWSDNDGVYGLASEMVVQGDPRLLRPDSMAQPADGSDEAAMGWVPPQ